MKFLHVLKNKQDPHYVGHRCRLRARFEKDPKSLTNYELIELLLQFVNTRCDTKPQAKALLKHFHNLSTMLHAPTNKLKEIQGVGLRTGEFFHSIAELFRRVLQERLKETDTGLPLFNSVDKVANYFQHTMQHLDIEHFKALFLDAKGHWLEEKTLQKGTIDKAAVYPREIIKHALACNGKGVILAHNHPSGCPKASAEDIAITKHLQSALKQIDVLLVDHIIIGKGQYMSLKAHALF